MDATTMETGGPVALPKIEGPAAEAPGTIVNALQSAGWFGLGLIAYAVQGTGWLIKATTEKGREVAPTIATPFKAAGETVEEALGGVGSRLKSMGQAVGKSAEAVEQAIDDRIAAVVQRTGAPLLSEMNELKSRVEELSRKIENLQTKRDRPEKSAQ